MSSRRLDVALEGVRHLRQHPLRSLLGALTSAIAIAVTVNVISLSFGLEEDIRGDVDLFGRRTVDVGRLPVIVPGVARPPLGPAEAQRVRARLEGLGATVVPRRQVVAKARGVGPGARPTDDRVAVVAAAPDYLATLSIPVLAGRWLEGADGAPGTQARVCALDAAAARRLFDVRDAASVVGRRLELDLEDGPRSCEIVGVLADPLRYRELFETFDAGQGARTLTSSLLSFRNVYVPANALTGEEFTGISIALPTDAAVEEARRRLLRDWPLDAADPKALLAGGVGVFVRRDWMDALAVSARQGTLLGNLVWVIIVLVAVVMITTLNLITIRERYDEVALRRCEGATRHDVAWQVTVEGTLTAILGGLAGLPIGYLGAHLLREIVDFPFRFELRYAVAATVVAVLLGLFASVLPARHAARLQPARVLGRRLR